MLVAGRLLILGVSIGSRKNGRVVDWFCLFAADNYRHPCAVVHQIAGTTLVGPAWRKYNNPWLIQGGGTDEGKLESEH